MVKKLHFKSNEAFRKYNAFRFIHGDEKKRHPKGFPEVIIAGHVHKVNHTK